MYQRVLFAALALVAAVGTAVVYGLAVVGAAFLLAWAAEVLQLDVSAGLALAVRPTYFNSRLPSSNASNRGLIKFHPPMFCGSSCAQTISSAFV